MDRETVIAKLEQYQVEFEDAMRSLVQYSVAVPTTKDILESVRARSIARGAEACALDGKNAEERAWKTTLWLENDGEYRRAQNEMRDMECGVEHARANVEIAKMGVRVMETVAKLLVAEP